MEAEAPFQSSLAFPDQAPVGEGQIGLQNTAGSTMDGEESWELWKDDLIISTLGVPYKDMNGQLPTYIYLDGKEEDKGRLGDYGEYQTQIDNQGNNLQKDFMILILSRKKRMGISFSTKEVVIGNPTVSYVSGFSPLRTVRETFTSYGGPSTLLVIFLSLLI